MWCRGSEAKDLLNALKSVYATLLSEGSRFEVVYTGNEDKGGEVCGRWTWIA